MQVIAPKNMNRFSLIQEPKCLRKNCHPRTDGEKHYKIHKFWSGFRQNN